MTYWQKLQASEAFPKACPKCGEWIATSTWLFLAGVIGFVVFTFLGMIAAIAYRRAWLVEVAALAFLLAWPVVIHQAALAVVSPRRRLFARWLQTFMALMCLGLLTWSFSTNGHAP